MILMGRPFESVVRGAVDRRMDEHMTAHLHVGGEKYDIIMTLL